MVVTNPRIPSMSAARSTLRTAWLSMLVLLLGLMPFIHGHLGQPVQGGWHIHALSATAEVRASPRFDGLACLAGPHHHATQHAGFVLHAPEPGEVELASGIAQSRLSQICLASAFTAVDMVHPALDGAPQRASAEPAVIQWPQAPDGAVPRVRHGLPPPGQAPPSILV